MVLTLEISSEPDLKWNDRLKTSPYGTIYHGVWVNLHHKTV